MSNANEDLIRAAYDAFSRGDLTTMLDAVDPDLEWTFLEPSSEDPEPQVCHGRHELEYVLSKQAGLLKAQLEEVDARGDLVMVRVRIPGIDQLRARKTGDVNYSVFTVRDGRIVALRDCRNREEAVAALAVAW